jgi:hypothetical protein
MPLAPCIELENGKRHIPQHHLQFQQTVDTVSEILHDIEAVEHILLFAGHDECGLYLQAGAIGPDNYDRAAHGKAQRLVYGRKWRIETYTPTSEVIQTALLAIKKACEHEVRELLTLSDPVSGKAATPFSTHGDAPLMARYPELVLSPASGFVPPLRQWLDGIRFAGRQLRIEHMAAFNGCTVLNLSLDDDATAYPTQDRYGDEQLALTVLLRAWDQAALLHEIMNALVQHSDRMVEEQFRYRGLARFSQRISPLRLAQLSIATRTRGPRHDEFEPVRKQINFEIDAQRAPSMGKGKLVAKNRRLLDEQGPLGGHMPHDWSPLRRAAETGA